MSRLVKLLRDEPVLVRGFITALAGLVVAYGIAGPATTKAVAR